MAECTLKKKLCRVWTVEEATRMSTIVGEAAERAHGTWISHVYQSDITPNHYLDEKEQNIGSGRPRLSQEVETHEGEGCKRDM